MPPPQFVRYLVEDLQCRSEPPRNTGWTLGLPGEVDAVDVGLRRTEVVLGDLVQPQDVVRRDGVLRQQLLFCDLERNPEIIKSRARALNLIVQVLVRQLKVWSLGGEYSSRVAQGAVSEIK